MATKSSSNVVNIVVEIIAVLLGVGFFILFWVSISTLSPFPYGQPPLTVPLEQIPELVTKSLWHERGIDMLLQALLLFVTAVGAAAMFRVKRRKTT